MKTKNSILLIAVSVLLTIGGSVWAQKAEEVLTMTAFPEKMKEGYKANDFILLEKSLPEVRFTNDESTLVNGIKQGKLPVLGEKYDSKTIQELYARAAEKLGVDFSPIGRGETINLYTAIREKL